MRIIRTTATAGGALAVWFAAAAGLAQEGYPLDGTWRGAWGTDADGTRVVVVMDWDGERINGTINPGPKSYPFGRAALDPNTWTVRIEAESPDLGPVVIEGILEDIGSYNRYIEGKWTHGGEQYPFKMTRE